MKVRYESNLTGGIVSATFGLILWYLIPRQIGLDFATVYGVSSRTIPYGLSLVFITCGLLLISLSLMFKKKIYKEILLQKELKAIGFMAVLVSYAYLFSLSYLLSTISLGVLTLLFSGSKKKFYYLVVVLIVGLLYLVFTQVLRVRLPL